MTARSRGKATPPARLGAACLEALPVGERQRALHRRWIIAAVVLQSHRIAIWHRPGLNEIAAPQLHAIEAVAPRGDVDEALEHVHHLGAARAPVRVRRRRVRQHRAAAHVAGREVVETRQHADALTERNERHGMGADVARVHAAQGEEGPVGVQRQLHLRQEIARLEVGEEGLATLARPLHRATHAPGGPRHQRELRIARVARAVVAPDVPRDHAQRARRDAERLADIVFDPLHAAGAGVEGVVVPRAIVDAQRGARLHRDAGDAVHLRLEPNDVGGARERGVGGGDVATVGVDAHVGARLVPDERRARRLAVGRGRYHRQWRVFHAHGLGAVARRGRHLRDHHRDRLADQPHATIRRQRRMRRDEVGCAVAVAQLWLVRVRRHRAVRNRLEPVGGHVGAGQHGDHARHLERTGHIDTDDARVRMR